MNGLLSQAFIYLCAAVIAVPIAKRLGLGSVLGYLLAGVVIGPLTGLVGAETVELQHFAEFGVVMMLFLVGLELKPSLLWQMRGRLLGLGGLQVVLSTALLAGGALALGLSFSVALAVGMILALSSTAIVLQTLNEKGLMQSAGGQAGFAVLLFQDIAVIPMLALLPLLALPELAAPVPVPTDAGLDAGAHGASLVAGLPPWLYVLAVLGAIAAVVLGGHFLSRPLFRFIAAARLREVFTAAALLLVVGIALLMIAVGLSPALGAFLAGVVLADSEFRHELESAVEPFKGLLLGLFFITVGAGIDFTLLGDQWPQVAGLTAALIAVKALVLYLLARLFRLSVAGRWLLTLGLAQAGEFGFVLLAFSVQNAVLPAGLAHTLTLVVTLSMLLTPALFIARDRIAAAKINKVDEREADTIDQRGTAIIAGVGRFGQIVNRLLSANDIPTVVLDVTSAQVERLRTVGIESYFGDASRPELLHAAGIDDARLLVVAIDDRDRAVDMVEYVRHHYPKVRVLARAYDRPHLYLLRKAGAHVVVRETFDAAVELGAKALRDLGLSEAEAARVADAFRRYDTEAMNQLYEVWDADVDFVDNPAYVALVREHADNIQQFILDDRERFHSDADGEPNNADKPVAGDTDDVVVGDRSAGAPT